MLSQKVFDFSIPVKVHFEVGGAKKIGSAIKAVGGSNVLIVTDKGVAGAGLHQVITSSLEKEGLSYSVFDKIEANPSTETVEKGHALFKEKGCDVVVGIGGGSPIDAAKAIALLTANPLPLAQYEGPDKVPNPVAPIFAVPTTAGTGSEINGSTVLTDRARKYKMSIRSSHLVPELALLDPALLCSLPPIVVAPTGMDALVHAIEAYVSVISSPATDGLAIEAIRLVGQNLRAFYASPDSLEAASNMLMASAMACMSFSNARLGVIHAIAHVLGGRYNIAHGVACAVLLPHAMEYSLIGAAEKFGRIAVALGEPTKGLTKMQKAKTSVEAVKKLMNDIDMPLGLAELGTKEED
ncbi:MAG: iron-containing alcohol dehydrogenase, partial [Desulfarculaceae bacterium]